MNVSRSTPAPETRRAANACLAALAAAPDLPQENASPRRAMGALASRLRRELASADAIRIVRAGAPDAPGDAWHVAGASASAWPLRYAADKPLLYLCRADTLAALRGVLVDTRARGIVCNDAEGQGSRWPKGVHPGLPAWLAAQHDCTPFDPACGGEVRAIVRAALETLYVRQQPGYYYLAMHDEQGTATAALSPEDGAAACLGMYRLPPPDAARPQLRLCGAGRALALAQEAARLLREDWDIGVEVWSCPSYTRLARDGEAAAAWNLRHPRAAPRSSHVQRCLGGSSTPVIAVTAYGQHIAGQIGGFARGRFLAIGADSRCELSAPWLAVAALKALADDGVLASGRVADALRRYGLL